MIYLALPVMNEELLLPLLVESVLNQTVEEFKVIVCINQPESYWNEPEKVEICNANQRTLQFIISLNDSRFIIIDRSSKGKGWTPQKYGIGYARKVIMDFISEIAEKEDIILSMDADTSFYPNYFKSIQDSFLKYSKISAISVPYYHNLSSDSTLNRAMLRYEIYMRAYAINLWRINNPYCFTALGSAFALPVKVYRALGGMTPKLSGEDFYFLQKIVKTGKLIHWNDEMVYPATRYSDRVFFGTGPALRKGKDGDWSSYPVYHHKLFDAISETYSSFNQLFISDIPTPLDVFLRSKFRNLPWEALRQNFKTASHFIRACSEKIDGLRILQFLKENQPPDEKTSEMALYDLLLLLKNQFPNIISYTDLRVDFANSDLELMNKIRNMLCAIEMSYRSQHANNASITKD